MRKITSIILHCSATPEGKDIKTETIRNWHVKGNGWKDIGYHYVIELDGSVKDGRPVEQVGAHCKNHNSNSIGICYVGGIDDKRKPKDTRTVQQKESMFLLVYRLLNLYGLSFENVYCHNQFDNKSCPSFKIGQFRNEFSDWVSKYLKNKKES